MPPSWKDETMQRRASEAAPWPPVGVVAALALAVTAAAGSVSIDPVWPDGHPVPRRRPTAISSPEGRAVAPASPMEARSPRLKVLDGLPRRRLLRLAVPAAGCWTDCRPTDGGAERP